MSSPEPCWVCRGHRPVKESYFGSDACWSEWLSVQKGPFIRIPVPLQVSHLWPRKDANEPKK